MIVVGLNHRSVPLGLLERVNVAGPDLPKALHDLISRAHLSEAVVLSTCMRTEVYAEAERFHGAAADIRNFLAEWSGSPPEVFSDHLYSYFEEAAVSHLFSVAAGLDSAVLGEGEILGQVREAWDGAREEAAAGPVMARLFRHALEVGKRARTETAIARGVTSISQAAVALASETLGGLGGRSVLVLGAGKMGEGMAVALAGRGVRRVLLASRTGVRAESLADRVQAEVVELAEVDDALGEVDLVLTATGSPTPLFGRDELDLVMSERPGRPLFIVDVAVPRDVDPAVRLIPGVTLLDMDDLRAFAQAGVESRQGEVARVRAIVEAEVVRHTELAQARAAAPVIAALRERAEAVRQAELARLGPRLGDLDERQRAAVEALTRGVVAKLLHEPTVRLKDEAGTPRGERLAEAVRVLFGL